jgi:hypothetical protein
MWQLKKTGAAAKAHQQIGAVGAGLPCGVVFKYRLGAEPGKDFLQASRYPSFLSGGAVDFTERGKEISKPFRIYSSIHGLMH